MWKTSHSLVAWAAALPLFVGLLLFGLDAPHTDAAPAYVGVTQQPLPYGDAATYGQVAIATSHSFVGMAATPDSKGYWLVGSDGGVFSYGDARFDGSTGSLVLNQPVVGMAATPDGGGYWLVAADGGVFAYGDARFYGSAGSLVLNQPVVGMAATPDGGGYWLVAADGGVFAYGDARFDGSGTAAYPNSTVVGMAADPRANGYWLVDSLGNVTAYGGAPSSGSIAPPFDLNAQIAGIAPSNDGNGYWLVSRDGGVFAFGDAPFEGSTGGQQVFNPVIALVPTHDGNGYWLLTNSPVPPPGVPILGRGLPALDEIGFGLVAPTSTFAGGDPAGATGSIVWGSWGGPEATGTGIALYAAPGQPEVDGSDQPAAVVAFDLESCDGQLMYQAYDVYFPEFGQSFDPSDALTFCH